MEQRQALSPRAVAQAVLVVVAVLIGLYLLYLIREVIALVLIAIFLAIALAPAVELLARRRVPRPLAILIIYLALILVVFGLGVLFVPPVVEGVEDFVASVPSYVEDLRTSETFREFDEQYGVTEELTAQAESLPERLGDVAGALGAITVGAFTTIFQLVTVLAMAFFFLLDGRRMVDFGLRRFRGERASRAQAVASDVYGAVAGYVTGVFSIAVVAGVSTYIVLSILGISFAITLSILMAFLVLIPLVGATIGGLLIAVVCALEDFPTALIVWVVFAIAYQQVENYVLQPFIYKRTVAVHPLLVIIAVLIGGSQLGVLGALLAIPVAATVQIMVKDLWRFRTEGHGGQDAPPGDGGGPPGDGGDGPPPPAQEGPGASPAPA